MADVDINLMCEETLDEPFIETKPVFVQLNDELVEVIQIETVNYYEEDASRRRSEDEQEHHPQIPPNFLQLITKYEPAAAILPNNNSQFNADADVTSTELLPEPGIDSSVTENLFSQFNNFDSNEHETQDSDNVEHEFKFEPPDPSDLLEPKCELVLFENEDRSDKKGKIKKRKNAKRERKVESSSSAKNPNILVRRSARLKVSKTASSSAIIATDFIKSEPKDDHDYGDSVNSDEDPASDGNHFLDQKLIIPSDPDPDREETEFEDRPSTAADYYSIAQLFDAGAPSRKSKSRTSQTTGVATLPDEDEGDQDFRPFQCQLCPKSFKLKYLLQYHIESHNGPDHPSRDYKCQKCSRAYVYKCHLIKHQRTHSKNVKKPFTCPVPDCGRAFSAKGNLKLHALVHSEDRPFKCPHPGCGSAFKYSNYMKLHVLTHIDKEEQERPFVCNLCGMSFQFNSGLAQHHRTAHSTARPFSCPHSTCEKTFKNKHEIIEHLRFHVDEMKCLHPDCHKFFKCPKLLQKHFRSHLF